MFLLTIVEYASIWAPSLIAILGIVVMVIQAIHKVKIAIEDMRADKTLSDVKHEILNTQDQVAEVMKQNQELTRCNKLLLDQLSKVTDYADVIGKKGEK